MRARARTWRERRRAARRAYDERCAEIDDELRRKERHSGVSSRCAAAWLVVLGEVELIAIVLLTRAL